MSDIEKKQTPGILVNRVNWGVNEVDFDRKYTVLHAEYAAYDVKNSAVRLLKKFSTVKSTRYEYGGKSFYVLLKGNSEKAAIIETLNTIVLDEPVREEKFSQIPPDIMYDLLLIGLSDNNTDREDDGENLSYSNLDGGVYTFEPEDVKEDRVVTFNIKARKAKDCVDLFGETQILFPAQTFASVSKMNETEEDRKYLVGLPRFQMVDSTYMKLSNGGEFGSGGREYVRHGYRKMNKASIDFLALSGVQDFDRCKMGRTRLTLRKMRREYADIGFEAEFVRTDLFDGNKYCKKNTGFDRLLKGLWDGRTVHIVDKVKSPTSESIIRGITLDMKKEFNVDIVPSDEVVKDDFNIVVVFKSMHDSNHLTYGDAMVQHISVVKFAPIYHRKDEKKLKELFEKIENEKITNQRKSSLVVILSDLIIKDDVLHGKQTFFDWYKERILDKEPVNTLDRKWRFYDRVRIENTDPDHRMDAKFSDKMGCLELNTDGSMTYRLIEESEVKEDFQLQLIWNQFNKDQGNIKGVMSDGENTYAFLSTDVRMIPEIDMIRQKLRENEKGHAKDESVSLTGDIRTRGSYEMYLKACTDVRYAYVKSDCYYFVGVRGDNIDTVLHWSAGLLRIKRLEGSENVPEVAFDMMLAPFVRLNRFTIVPYPFKYLREFEKTHGLENFVPEDPSEEETGKDKEYQWTLDTFGL